MLNVKFKLYSGDFLCDSCAPKAGITDMFTPKRNEKLTNDVVLWEIQLWENSVEEREVIAERQQEAFREVNARKCPSCQSKNIDFMQNKRKSFSVGKAVAGTVLTGGIGAIAGFAGKKGNNQWHCKDCGQIFETRE